MDGLGVKGAFMFDYVEDKEYLSVYAACAEKLCKTFAIP